MGDFNAKPNSKAVRTMRENLHGYQNVKLQDIYGFLDQLIGNTYHGFTERSNKNLSQSIIFCFRMILKW